jgi:hypothetical protein
MANFLWWLADGLLYFIPVGMIWGVLYLIAFITQVKIKGYYVWMALSPRVWHNMYITSILEKHISFEYCEQVVYRSLRCPECLEAGKCADCNCTTPGLFMSPESVAKCKKGRWPKMQKPEEWRLYKQAMGIFFELKSKY